MKQQTVIVTGASGYIGGQTLLALKDRGCRVIGIDRRPPPAHLFHKPDRFYQENFSNDYALNLISEERPDAIVHCAGTSLVGPSMTSPGIYYENNFVNTKKLLDSLIKLKHKTRVIFSSSAAVYGDPVMVPCSEGDPPLPISPYGESKLMVEQMLRSYQQAYGIDYVAFRYFNACGADRLRRHGQEHGATHIIARVLESIKFQLPFTLNGSDYPTPDGTCVRDYVHVEDIAEAHCLALNQDLPGGVYNLGTKTGASNREIISKAEEITGNKVNITLGQRRPGDPSILTASADKWVRVSGWQPKFNLDDIIQHSWAWYKR